MGAGRGDRVGDAGYTSVACLGHQTVNEASRCTLGTFPTRVRDVFNTWWALYVMFHQLQQNVCL